ncbi:zf-C3HC4 3 domain containing protein [Trichuris trichiura]|uniref:Zf-C3HC4 3 domain containing protein n=1 Tax=Trichuris trichiura TaxID=36087 RepID=A0A077Z227_TRITR|nr:zf-C3HC4 3 domain containing protein [Trichuris trichiura]
MLLKVLRGCLSSKMWYRSNPFVTWYANLVSDSLSSAVAEWGDDQEEQDECKICMVSRVDSAFYPCGHYSMCYPCAKLTFRKQGVCPICRKPIRDVLKIFKS